jgi:methylenetetrahydrofolate--tRNA-(uracil-5-)-methyltransferase
VTSVPPPAAPGDAIIIATGPLTSDALSQSIQAFVGDEHLAFYDAISPIVLAESIDREKVFRQSRWGRSLRRDTAGAGAARTDAAPVAVAAPVEADGPACGVDDGEGDYLNCPFTKAEYDTFYDALTHAESATVHDFDSVQFFEGCLPIEVMAHRGRDTLRFGPMKPVGLRIRAPGGARTRPCSCVRTRSPAITSASSASRPRSSGPSRRACCGMIPGLEHAEFVRFGMVHRNTFINGPKVLLPTWQTKARPDLFFAGQMSGVEGYVESAASGLIAGRNAARVARASRRWRRRARRRSARWPTTRRTPTRSTTSRRTSPSASCRRSRARPQARPQGGAGGKQAIEQLTA